MEQGPRPPGGGTAQGRDSGVPGDGPAGWASAFRLPGVDLVLEGEAARTVDPDVLAHVAAGFRDGGWPAEVAGDALTAPFSAQSAGPPPWHLYRFVFHTAVGVSTEEPFGAARWSFAR